MARMGPFGDQRGADFAAMRYVAAVAVSLGLVGVAAQGWGQFQLEADSARCAGELGRVLGECRQLFVHAPPACPEGCGSSRLDVVLPQGCWCTFGARPHQGPGEAWSNASYALLPNGTLLTLLGGVPVCGAADGGCAPVVLGPGTHHVTLDVRGLPAGPVVAAEDRP